MDCSHLKYGTNVLIRIQLESYEIDKSFLDKVLLNELHLKPIWYAKRESSSSSTTSQIQYSPRGHNLIKILNNKIFKQNKKWSLDHFRFSSLYVFTTTSTSLNSSVM